MTEHFSFTIARKATVLGFDAVTSYVADAKGKLPIHYGTEPFRSIELPRYTGTDIKDTPIGYYIDDSMAFGGFSGYDFLQRDARL